MENELRRLKGIEHFNIPVLTPNAHTIESNIQLEAYCQAVDNEVKTIFKETFKPERTRIIEGQRRNQQSLLPTATAQKITRSHQPTFPQAEIQTRPTTTTPSLLQSNQHQSMTPPQVNIHILQQQNTPTREHPNSHLSRHSTPIRQRTTNAAAAITNTILKTTAPSSCVNTQTTRHNLHWNSPIDTEFTMVTSHQNTAMNDVRYMNLSSNQLTIPAMVTGGHNPILAHTDSTENRRESPMCASNAENKDTNSKDAGNKMSSAPSVNVTTTMQKPVEDTQPQWPKHQQRQE